MPVGGVAYILSRTYVVVSSGAKWPTGFPDNYGSGESRCEKGTGTTDKTLTESEIEAVSAKIIDKVTKATGGTLRG